MIENTTAQTPTQVVGFLDNLRQQTAPEHRNLESLPISKILVDPTIDRASYFKYLSLMRDAVADAEQHIFPQLQPLIPDLEARFKTSWLDSDLRVGGMPNNTPEKVFSSKESISIPFALGIFYVMEGSTLGGRFILKNIEKALDLNETNGATYFYGYGNHTGSKWKEFLSSMTQYESETNSGATIIEGAKFAFAAIHAHFAKHS